MLVGGLALVAVFACVAAFGLDPPYAYLGVLGIVPWLVVRGYYVRVVRTTIGTDRPTPPRFEDLRGLLSDGVAAVGIAAAYLLAPVGVLAPLVALRAAETDLSAIAPFGAIPDGVLSVAVPIVGLLAVVALMALLGALYVLPVAVARYAHSGRLRDAVALRTVVDGALTEDYAIAWGVSMLLQALLLPVAYLLRVLLVGFFLQFIVAAGVRYCYGQGVGAALGLSAVDAGPDPDADERTARDPDAPPEADLTPAVVRVDTERWGVGAEDPDSAHEPYPAPDRDAATNGGDHPGANDGADGALRNPDGPSAVGRVGNGDGDSANSDPDPDDGPGGSPDR